ncbi:MAG: hypothetical protein Q8R13_03235 [bacterium]|nr:hypothetical protein [bacterium]
MPFSLYEWWQAFATLVIIVCLVGAFWHGALGGDWKPFWIWRTLERAKRLRTRQPAGVAPRKEQSD